MKHLTVPWYPTAGNHDIAWRAREDRKMNMKAILSASLVRSGMPSSIKLLVYCVVWRRGRPADGERTFHKASLQKVSPRQTAWLKEMLEKAKGADQVFLFIHHPRWKGGNYGDDWQRIHKMLVEAGNVKCGILPAMTM